MAENSGASLGPLTGWEPDAPPADTIVRQFIDSQAAFQKLAGESLGATVIGDDGFIAVDTGRPSTFVNVALLRKPLIGDELDRTMREINALFERPGATGYAIVYSPLPTPDLSKWGWELSGHPPLQIRSPYTPTIDTSTHRIERVTTVDALRSFERIMIEGFDMHDMRETSPHALFAPALLDDARFGAWLGYLDGEPVAGAGSMVDHGLVDVVMVATLPQARRKGLGLAVTQAAAQPHLGLPAALFSSDEGRPVYERLGFVPILRGSFWHRDR